MEHYELNCTAPSPGNDISFVEFSPSGRFIATGNRDDASVRVLDRRSGFHQILSTATPAEPTALVWESPKAFYVGLKNGTFLHYQINADNGAKILEKGSTNNFFYGTLPVTAMGLDKDSKTLVLSVGPGVFALRRVNATSEFRFIGYISSRFDFPSDTDNPSPPFPRSICFIANNTLVVTFCRQRIASVALEFDRDSNLSSSFQTARVDYTGLPVLKAITSASEEDVHNLSRCWIYGHDDSFPFLFIHGGAATISGTTLGAAVIRNAVTQQKVQLLGHTGVLGRCVPVIAAYHISKESHTIVTVDRGENAKIKVWAARRASTLPQNRTHRGSLFRKGLTIVTLLGSLTIIVQQQRRIPDITEILCFFSQIRLVLVHFFIYSGHAILEAIEAAVEELADVLD